MNIKEQYRLALRHLMQRHAKEIRDIAIAGGIGERQVQHVLSGKGNRGFRGPTAEKIAALFGLSYAEMLDLGRAIAEGEDPRGNYQQAVVSGGVSIQAGRDARAENISPFRELPEPDKLLIEYLLKYGNSRLKEELFSKLERIKGAMEEE